ncbi:MAG TPA: FTR1 family protein [Actinomycetes bacterium]|nr:FTR1 family protein [Actinomycetes bacterium]
MLTAFFVMLREGFEAALIVAILYAYLRKTGRQDLVPTLWAGIAAAFAIAIAGGVVIQLTVESLDGAARLRWFAGISLFAVGVLTWMIFWMRRHARAIRGELHHSIDRALSTGSSVRWAIALAAFFAVLREGLEAVLFMIATAITEDRGAVIIGALAGLAVASLLGYAVVLGGRKMPMRQFFTVTGVLLIVFAAGLLARAVMFLQTAGDLPIIWNNVYDLTGIDWLTTRTEVGRFLGAMFGWDPRPSIEQVIAWLGYAGTVTYLFLRTPRGRQLAPQAPAPQPVVTEKQVTS